jgi:maltooligosyltrehalose trehalohydrolase
LLTGERDGFYADFGRVAHLAKAFSEGYVLSGQHSRYRGRRHGADSAGVAPERFFAYSQMHDQVGNRPHSDRLTTLVGFERVKLAAASVLLSPYQPLLFMGEEYGEPAPFHYFISHGDPELVERVRAGRRREFAPFRWQGEPADPQAESTFAASKLNRGLRHAGPHRAVWDFYRELLRLRRELPALRSTSRDKSRVEFSEDSRLLISLRTTDDSEVAVLLHFSDGSLTTPLPACMAGKPWIKLFDSSDPRWLGPSPSAVDRLPSTGNLTLGPWAAVVYQRD